MKAYTADAARLRGTNKERPMNNSLIDDGRSQHAERLQEAEAWRLAKLVSAANVSPLDRLRVELGDRLINLGRQLKGAAQPAPELD